CHQPISPEEKATRAQLRAALRAKNWEQAIPLGRKVLELSPHEDGSWARLAEAQIGQRDVPGLKVTIDRWEQDVHRKSFKLEEHRGDLAEFEGRSREALANWEKAIAKKGRTARLFRKVARAQQANGKWQEAALAWTQSLAAGEALNGLLN